MLVKNLFYQPMDKMSLYYHFFRTLYNNASKVILIEGLPDDADYHFILSQLLLVGRISVFKDKGKIYLLNGNIGGKCDEYYYPTRILIANPILGSFDLERGKEAVQVYLTPADRILDSPMNTNMLPGGMYSLISMCANLLSECVTTINVTLMNTRVHAIYTADTDSAAKSAEPILKRIYMGQPYSVVTSELLERLNVNPLSEHGLATTLTETIEVCQYILAMFWNGLGVDMPFNMKRERLVTAEVDKNLQSLIVPVQTILETLNEGFEKVNSLFDTNIHAILNPDFELVQENEPVQESEVNDELSGDEQSIRNDNTESELRENEASSRADKQQSDSSGTSSENSSESYNSTIGSESGTDDGTDSHSVEESDGNREEGATSGKDNVNVTINIVSGDNNDVSIESQPESLEDSNGKQKSEEDSSSQSEEQSESSDKSSDKEDDK